MFRLFILVALAGAGLLALPAFAAVVTTFSLDTNDPLNDDTFSGPVFTSTLELGQPYLITISGTWSYWGTAGWGTWTGTNASDVCAGQAEELPQIQSPGVTNGPVGMDPEYAFAWILGTGTLCPGGSPIGSPPLHLASLQISLDGGSTWQHLEPIDKAYNPEHSYQYLVVGLGSPADIGMRLLDFPTSDNYGVFTATVEATDAGAFAVGNGKIVDVSGNEADLRLVSNNRRGTSRGSLKYEDETGMKIRADSFTAILVLKSTNTAYLTGNAFVNNEPGHSFLLIVQDNGDPGAGNDTFRLDVDGVTIANGTITSGNFQIRGR